MANKKDQLANDLSKFVTQAQWGKALQALEGLIKLEPTNAQYYLRRGDYSVKAGEKAAAIKSYYQAADMFVKAGFSVKGIATYKMILRIAPEETQAATLMKAINAYPVDAAPPPEPLSPKPAVELAPLFASFTQEEFGAIVDYLEPLEFMEGGRIIAEGEDGDAMYFISRGKVRVVKKVEGREVLLAELTEGEFFGGMSLLAGSPRSASVFAQGETEVLRFKVGDLFAIMKRYPHVVHVLEEFYERRSKATRQKIRDLRK